MKIVPDSVRASFKTASTNAAVGAGGLGGSLGVLGVLTSSGVPPVRATLIVAASTFFPAAMTKGFAKAIGVDD